MMFPLMAAVVLAASPNSLPTSSPPGALISMEFDGTLKDGLKQLAQKSGLNLVVIGDFDEHVNLNLPSVNGEEALETIAQAYGLEVTRSGKAADGKMWVIRRASPGSAGPAIGPVPMVPPVPPAAPVPVVAPTAVQSANVSVEAAREGAERARQAAEAAREQADQLREKAEAMREATQDAREQAREAAEQAREEAQEAAELAREQAQEAVEAERERAEALREEGQAKAELFRAQAELERHRVSAGGPITVEKGSRVDTAVAYGGPVIVQEGAVVEGDAVAFGGDVVLEAGAKVEGDAVSFGGSVVRGEGSVVEGESVSMGGAGFGTAVARKVVKTHRFQRSAADPQGEDEADQGRGQVVARFLLEFAVLFGLGFMMMMFAPQRMKALEATVRAEPGKNGLAGFLGALASIPLSLMVGLTIVGIPVVFLAWMAIIGLVWPVGLTVVANAVGAKLPTGKLRKTQAVVLAGGVLALLLVFHIPVLGVMMLMIATAISLGAIIRTRFGQNSRSTPMLDPMRDASPAL